MVVKYTTSNKKDTSSVVSKGKSYTVDVKRKNSLKNTTQRNLQVATSSNNVANNFNSIANNITNENSYVVCCNCKNKIEKKLAQPSITNGSTNGDLYQAKRTYGKEIMGFMPPEDHDAINFDIEYIINLCTSDLWDLE